mgnify:FL=1
MIGHAACCYYNGKFTVSRSGITGIVFVLDTTTAARSCDDALGNGTGPMSEILSHLLKRYEDRAFVIRLKARFIAYCFLTEAIVILVAIVYSGVAQLSNPLYGYAFNLKILGPLAGGFVLSLLGIGILARGYYTLSAHFLVVCGLATVWTVIYVDQTYALSRLDSIVFVIALLALLPIVILKRPFGMVVYAAINIALLYGFMALLGGELNLANASTISYLADNTIAILAVSTISYQVYTINRRALEKAEHDLQERKRAEAVIRENEAILSSILNSAPIAVFVLGPDRVLNNVVGNTLALLGYTQEEMMGRNTRFLYFSDEDYRQAGEALLGNAASANMAIEAHLRRKDGTETWVLLSRYPGTIVDVSIGWVIAAIDISARKNIEEQLRQAQKMEAVGQLAGGVAHDFNNMLSVVIGNAELMMQDLTPADPLYPRIRTIQDASERSTRLVRQLLAFARKQAIHPVVLDINETIAGMIKVLRRLIGEDISLVWVPGPEMGKVKIDPSQFDQLLTNLLVNARDAIDGVGKVTIETGNRELDAAYFAGRPDCVPGHYVMLAVSDDGCGMDDPTLEQIFEPFFTTKAADHGTGLGLATVYGIVKQNNGNIHVYSEPGSGTTIKLYLPLVEASDSDDDAEARVLHQASPEGTETVLVVEDDAAILEMVEDILSQLGYTVIATNETDKALEIAGSTKAEIDLLVTDVVMPVMNGRELAKKIEAIRPGIKCLYMSGYPDNAIGRHGVLDDGVCFLPKPFSLADLARKVREALDRQFRPCDVAIAKKTRGLS